MPQREPKPQPPSPFVTIYRKDNGRPSRVPKIVAERIKNPPEGEKSKTFQLTEPKPKKDKETSS